MKAIIKDLKIVGESELISEIKYGARYATNEKFHIDDQYTTGVPKYSIVTVKKGNSNGVEDNTWHIADNTDTNVLPMGIVISGSINRKLAGHVEFKKRLPRPEEIEPLPLINWIELIVEAYDASGNRVSPAFELEDYKKPVFLGKQGKITVDKPTTTEYNTPIGYISSKDRIMIDFVGHSTRYETPVTKN